MIIELTKEEWVEVIQLVEQKSGPSYDMDKQNKFNDIKTKMLWQLKDEK